MMFLEAQFGAANVSPIAEPKLPSSSSYTTSPTSPATTKPAGDDLKMEGDDDDKQQEDEEEKQRALELARLHKLGIPVPGVRIKVDKMEARVWLEGLEVECGNRVFADRVRAVVERAVEVGAPLWG